MDDSEALRIAEDKGRQALIDALDDAIVIATRDGVVRQINSAFERMVGYDRSDLPCVPPLPWLSPPDGEDTPTREQAVAELYRFAEDARSDPSGRTTLTLCHVDGRELIVNVSVSALKGTDTVVALMRDVTAEIIAAGRESALGKLALELADEADPDRLAQIGLEQVLEVFDADLAGLKYDDVGLDLIFSGEEGKRRVLDGLSDVMSNDGLRINAGKVQGDAIKVRSVGSRLFGSQGALWLGWNKARPFGPEDRALFTALAAQLGQAVQRASLDIERKQFATSIQQSILKSTPIPAHAAVRYVPALQPLEVGGDWYDVVDLGDGRTGLVIGDCVGRGVDAASTMIKLRSASRALLLRSPSPADVLSGTDDFARTVQRAFCATAMVGIVESDGAFHWASAAHVPGLLLRTDGTVEVLDGAQSPPLGTAGERREGSVTLSFGDRLVFCSDGLVERRGEVLDEGLQRLSQVCVSLIGEPVATMADGVLAELAKGTAFADDVALIVFEFRAVAPFRISLEPDLTRVKELRGSLRGWLESAGADEDAIDDILLAVSEAVDNSIEHSMLGEAAHEQEPVEIAAATNGSTISLSVLDHGTWRQADESGRSRNRGRGLKIIRKVMDSCEISTGPAGTRIDMVRRLR